MCIVWLPLLFLTFSMTHEMRLLNLYYASYYPKNFDGPKTNFHLFFSLVLQNKNKWYESASEVKKSKVKLNRIWIDLQEEPRPLPWTCPPFWAVPVPHQEVVAEQVEVQVIFTPILQTKPVRVQRANNIPHPCQFVMKFNDLNQCIPPSMPFMIW